MTGLVRRRMIGAMPAVPPVSVLVVLAGLAGAAAPGGAETREQACLNGIWLIHAGGGPDTIPDSGWTTVRVPHKQSGWYLEECDIMLGVMEGTAAWYRTAFEIPEGWQDGRRIALRFEGVNHHGRLFVNGRLAGEHRSVYVPFETDITGLVRHGERNELALYVADVHMPGMPDDFIDQLKWRSELQRNGGLIDDVFLRSFPPIHVSDVFLQPSVRRMQLTALVWVTNLSGESRAVTVRAGAYLGGELALAMAPRSATVPAGATVRLELVQPWPDPVLWGYGRYGSPTLYAFRTDLAAGDQLDTRFDRFGFREFWCEGDQLRLNGQEIFLTGDCIGIARAFAHVNNRHYVNMLMQALRDMNCNNLRLGWTPCRRVWMEVADEVGMTLEVNVHNDVPCLGPDKPINRPNEACVDCVVGEKARWTLDLIGQFVRARRNHPSVILWESNNEVGCQAEWGADPQAMQGLAEIAGLCRREDPTRPVDHQGSARTPMARSAGVALDAEIWNVHPYGDPIMDDVSRMAQRFGFRHDRPLIIGEVYQDAVLWGLPCRTDLERRQAHEAYQRLADFWSRSVLDARAQGADGIQLLSLNNQALHGPCSETDFEFGPWGYGGSGTPPRREPAPGERADLAIRAEGPQILPVQVVWPADSGPDLKVPALGWGAAAAYGNINWWDPSRKAYGLNIVAQRIKAAYALVSGGDLPPLPQRRSPELLVTLTSGGRPVPDRFVHLRPADGQPVPAQLVRTDLEGRAWFLLALPGRYEVRFRELAARTIVVEWGRRDRTPGYAFVQRCDLPLRAEAPETLTRPLNEPDVDRASFVAQVGAVMARRQQAHPPIRPGGPDAVEPRLMPAEPLR